MVHNKTVVSNVPHATTRTSLLMTTPFQTVSSKRISELWNTHVVKPKSYFRKAGLRYSLLTLEERIKWAKRDFPRLASLFDFQDWLLKYDLLQVEKLLATCAEDPELAYIEAGSTFLASYEKDPRFDLHILDLPQKDYDLCIFNQTLEHLYNPFLALRRIADHIKPGGFIYTTVSTINIPHLQPFHFWGITPIGLCVLAESVGLKVVEVGYWGNKEYVNYIFQRNTWPDASQVLGVNDQHISNDQTLVTQSQTWALFQKN